MLQRWCVTLVAFLLAVLAACSSTTMSTSGASNESRLEFEPAEGETCKDPIKNPILSPSGDRIAYACKTNGQWFVVVNGRRVSGEFEWGSDPIFSRDGRKIAFLARRANRWRIMVDGKQVSEWLDESGGGWPAFNWDGTKVASVARGPAGQFVLVNDRRVSREFDIVFSDGMVFSLHGDQIAYQAALRGKQFIMVDDKQVSAKFEYVGPPVFSPDGRRLAYSTKSNSKWSLVVDDGRVMHEAGWIGSYVFSPNSKQLAYVAEWESPPLPVRTIGVWVNGALVSRQLFDDVKWLTYSPDGEKLAYVARRGETAAVYVNDAKVSTDFSAVFGNYDVLDPIFCPDSERLAYSVRLGDPRDFTRDGDYAVVVQGRRVSRPGFYWIGPLQCTPNRELAFVGYAGGKIVLTTLRFPYPDFGAIPHSDPRS